MSDKIDVIQSYWPDGSPRYECSYRNNNPHGLEKQWYENGQLRYKVRWLDGEEHGTGKWWHENGYLKYESHHLYGETVTKEECREHELIERLAKINA